jgi:hypothetical protein
MTALKVRADARRWSIAGTVPIIVVFAGRDATGWVECTFRSYRRNPPRGGELGEKQQSDRREVYGLPSPTFSSEALSSTKIINKAPRRINYPQVPAFMFCGFNEPNLGMRIEGPNLSPKRGIAVFGLISGDVLHDFVRSRYV